MGGERLTRVEQTHRTREALVGACLVMIEAGAVVTTPAVARAAGTSEATAYRHFPDLLSLIDEGLCRAWPTPAEALAPVASSVDPVERIGFACADYLNRVGRHQGAVRAVLAATVTRPELVARRPGLRRGFIDQALDPVLPGPGCVPPARVEELKMDLFAVLAPEAFFALLDVAGQSQDQAVARLRRMAELLTAAALH